MKMRKKLLIVLMPFLSLIIIPFVVQAATITSCNLDREMYSQGETGYITVTIYNDKSEVIRVTELTATIDYYYVDEGIYVQTFFTDTTLPIEIQRGETGTFQIPFSLPTNIASGYTKFDVKAKTELWGVLGERWYMSEHPTFQQLLYVESPYKEQSEGRLSMMYLLGVTSIVFAVLTMVLILNRRARPIM